VKSRYWFVGIALLVLVWQILSLLLASLLMPGPVLVFKRLLALLVAGRLLGDIGWTLLRVMVGTGVGCLLGLVLGVLLAQSRTAFNLLDPVFQLLRPVSPFAWTPLVILIFGLGNAPAVFTITIGVFFPAIVIVYEALRNIDPDLRDIARIFGVSGWTLVRQVELPLIAPALGAALRVLFGVGWILAVGAEMLAANSGLGFRLMNARYLLDFAGLYALIIVIGIVGYLFDLALRQSVS
jgi:ABC-type nitrate/sulfonate/bicarbonate transport system permease component